MWTQTDYVGGQLTPVPPTPWLRGSCSGINHSDAKSIDLTEEPKVESGDTSAVDSSSMLRPTSDLQSGQDLIPAFADGNSFSNRTMIYRAILHGETISICKRRWVERSLNL